MTFKTVEDPNGGQRVEITDGEWKGKQFSVHHHRWDQGDPTSVTHVSIGGSHSESVILPVELVPWLAESVYAEPLFQWTLVETKIAKWWYWKEPELRPKYLTVLDVVEVILKVRFHKVDDCLAAAINAAMSRLGFARERRRFGRVWVPVHQDLKKSATELDLEEL